MERTEILVIVLGIALIIVVVLAIWLKIRLSRNINLPQTSTHAELENLRRLQVELERKLVVEQLASSRLPGLELTISKMQNALDESRADKFAVDEILSGIRASLQASQEKSVDLNVRLQEALILQKDTSERLSGLKDEKHIVEELLSGKVEALRGSDEKNSELQRRLADSTKQAESALERVHLVSAENAALKETVDQQSAKFNEKLTLLAQVRGDMTLQFKSLAEDVMSRHGESFSKSNKEQVSVILEPLRQKIFDFDQKIQSDYIETAKDRAALLEQIRSMASASMVMSKETRELTEALRGRSQVQGAWGEMVLNTVLEQSGLRSGQEFNVQQSFRNEEGARLRPDVIVNMPGGHRMVVDAKVSLTAFERFVNCSVEEDRAPRLQQHLGSIRNHISTLGSKEYHLATGTTISYVIMFIPIEGALAAAVQADSGLLAFAAERNVTLSTPTTLIMALKTIANVWQVERRNQNAEEIASRAGKLYDKFVGFLDDMTSVDSGINKARVSYDKAMSKLKTGNGNIVRQIEQLKEMGARTPKAISPSLVDASDELVTVSVSTRTVETEMHLAVEPSQSPLKNISESDF